VTSTNALIANGHVGAHHNPFALPIGWKGRLAGWYMGFADAQHRELVREIPVEGATRLVEIGFGPGQMLEMIHQRAPRLELAGVEPSELMVKQARRRNPPADLRLGAASSMPFPDGHTDLIIAVNNLPMWPDLDAALVEIQRVLRPGGTALLAWHGGRDPRGHQKALTLAPDRKALIDAAIQARFPEMRTTTLEHSETWWVAA
jgi:ubiquinone/menaquinone biosynthesis C-methylase UbiE